MTNTVALYDPRGRRLTKDITMPEGAAHRIISPRGRYTIGGAGDLKGAEPKVWDHRIYLDMYYTHPWLASAINTLIRTATNTGWEFVPRTKLAKANEGELAVATEFFSKQADFMGELVRIYQDLLLFGDAYLYIVPNRRRKPARLKRLAPWTIHIDALPNGRVKQFVQKDLTAPSYEAVSFQPYEILHFKINDPGNDLYGLSPLESLKTTITADIHMLNYQKNFFKNGASTGTIITVEEASDAEVDRMQAWVDDEFVGTENAWRPFIMAGKGIDVKKGVASHEDMSFLAGRNYFVSEIMAVLGVPPAKLGRMETANRSNAKEQDKSFRAETVAPLQNLVERVINDQFMRGVLGLEETVFEHSKADIRDAIEQMDLNTAAVGWGLNTINEIRNRMGYPNIDGGDVAFIMTPTGAVPVDRLDLYFQPPQTNTDTVPGIARSPATGEAMPQFKPNDKQGEGVPPANKSMSWVKGPQMQLIENVNAVRILLTRSDDSSLRQAMAYTADANECAPHTLFDQTIDAIRKALKSGDEDMRQAYVERAQGLIQAVIGN